ncbi:MAG: hypothetical protein R3D62_16645 [Xanthobacteraceae bacterium]
MSIARLTTALTVCLSIIGTTPVAFGFGPVHSLRAPADSEVLPIACRRGYQETTNYQYASKRNGKCPAGFVVPGGIAGSRCMKAVKTCIRTPHCGTGVC